MIQNPRIIQIYILIVPTNAQKYIELIYIHNKLLHILANHVAIFSEVKYKG